MCISNINVHDVTLDGPLQNGLRIKTYPGGQGAVTNVRYSNIQMRGVQQGIVLNQVRERKGAYQTGWARIEI